MLERQRSWENKTFIQRNKSIIGRKCYGLSDGLVGRTVGGSVGGILLIGGKEGRTGDEVGES